MSSLDTLTRDPAEIKAALVTLMIGELVLVDIARAGGATWERIAPHVGVADRRAAQTRRTRQG